MKINLENYLKGLFFLFLVFGVTACFNDDDDENLNLTYLVDFTPVRQYSPATVEYTLNLFASDHPDLNFLLDEVEYSFQVYKIKYNTTFQGETIVASGVVSVPIADESFPVMSYQNGTNTLLNNAPSVNPSNNDLYLLLEFVASTGMVISLPDYLGFGASDNLFHPYLHKESTVQTVLDMLRAVKELAQVENFELNNELFLTGYSLGGWATLQVQKAIEQQYSNEFNLVASSPSAGPYDLTYINDYIIGQTEYPMPYYVGFMFNSFSNLNEITTPIGDVFNSPYDALIPGLFDGTNSGAEINAALTTNVADLFTENYLQNYNTDESFSSIRSSLEMNSIEAWNASTPTLLVHGTTDEFVPFQVSLNMYNDFLSTGVSEEQVKLVPLPDLNHIEGIIPAGLVSVKWFLKMN